MDSGNGPPLLVCVGGDRGFDLKRFPEKRGRPVISNLVGVNTPDFLRLDAEIIQGLPLCAVVEADHELREPHPEPRPLLITKRFS